MIDDGSSFDTSKLDLGPPIEDAPPLNLSSPLYGKRELRQARWPPAPTTTAIPKVVTLVMQVVLQGGTRSSNKRNHKSW